MSDGPKPLVKNEVKVEPENKFEVDPVLETKDELVLPTNSCDDDDTDIEPLSGKPFFHITLLRSHVGGGTNKYQLVSFFSNLYR